MRVLDLFSGIGGFSLGLERAGMRTVAFCETDPYCRVVPRSTLARKAVPSAGDIREDAPTPILPTSSTRHESGRRRMGRVRRSLDRVRPS